MRCRADRGCWCMTSHRSQPRPGHMHVQFAAPATLRECSTLLSVPLVSCPGVSHGQNSSVGSNLVNMSESGLTSGDFTEESEPFVLFASWLKDAETSEVNDPTAVALATVDETGMPNVRMVLLKGFDENGFVFYTNFESRKGQEILGQKKAAMCFHWKSLRRQVRLRGDVEIVTDAEADAYYATRPRGSRIGAWASRQSRPLEGRL